MNQINQKTFKMNSWEKIAMLIVLCACCQAYGQTATTANPATLYTKMAPLDQYLMERNAEIALARSAAPDSISHDADILVLGSHAYENAVKGKNGFVCVVMRSWAAGPEDADFWNPKVRAPICFNASAARSNWPIILKRTELILAGMPKERVFESIQSSFDNKELPTIEPGSMSYMMSRDQYLGDAVGRWRPHLMFFVPQTSDMAWGAGVPGSPIIAGQDPSDHLTVFMIPLGKWSDGTAAHSNDKSTDDKATDNKSARDSHKH